MTQADGCVEGVETIRGQEFLFTGKAYVDGKWQTREACTKMLASRHAWAAADARDTVDVLVFGDLTGSKMVDEKNGHSQKAHYVFEQRLAGQHIHVVDGPGFSALLAGESAKCLDLVKDSAFAPLRVITDSVTFTARPAPTRTIPTAAQPAGRTAVPRVTPNVIEHVGRLFGAESSTSRPEQPEASRSKAPAAGPMDWDLWTREQVRRQLITAMRTIGVIVHDPGPGMPRFAGCWHNRNSPGLAFVADIQVIGNDEENEPIQPGIDRLLDYARRVPERARDDEKLLPVLILDHEPYDREWVNRAREAGVHLTWPAKFPGHVAAD